MSLNLREKKEIVIKINEVARRALSAIVADPRGVTVNKMTELRKTCREAGVYVSVIRNNLLYRAIEGTAFECMRSILVGPICIAFSIEHPGTAARLFKEFAQANTAFKIKAAAFSGELMTEVQIDRLANLPTYREAIIRLMILIKEVSLGRFVRVLVAVRNMKSEVF